jgi:hypothetical protein
MRSLVNRPALDFDELRFDWGDVVLAAIGWSEWQLLERTLAVGLACASEAEERGEQVDDDELRASVVRFRRARGLLAGEDYLRWLGERSLSTDDVRAHFSREALRGRVADRTADQLPSHRPDAGPLAEAIRGEAILSGRLRLWAERLARCAAAARALTADAQQMPAAPGDAVAALLAAAAGCQASGLDDAQATDRAPRIAGLQAAERTFAHRVATLERIDACLSEHRLDWQRFAWEEITFANEGAAREAALWVREDGMPLGEVADLAHVAAAVCEAYSDEVSELAGVLAAAAPGELLGPLAGDGGWRLVRLRQRTPPAIEDTVLHERARTELVHEALGRHLAGRVTWHGEH